MSRAGAADQPDVRAAWAKAGAEQVPHPLVCHAIDTAAVAEVLFPVLLGPRCRDELLAGLAPLENPAGWVAVLCGLHDLGKLSPAFQALRDDLALRHMGNVAAGNIQLLSRIKGVGRTDTPHGLFTAVHVERLLRTWGARREVAAALASVLGGHHGFIPTAASLNEAEDKVNHHGGKKWAGWCDVLVDELVRLWHLAAAPPRAWGDVRVRIGGAIGLAGLASVSDWIASDTSNFPYAGTEAELVAYTEKARELAEQAVGRMDWSRWQPPADTSFRSLFPRIDGGPRPIQQVVERLGVSRTALGIVIVEAPTGEGKTKAALQCAATCVRQLGLTGMYVGMPTRATSNHMFNEINDFVSDHAAELRARLLHSSADEHLAAEALRAGSDSGEPRPADVGRDEPGDGEMLARDWFTRKRGLLAPVAVGTVDQVLKTVIRSRHVFVGLAGLSGKMLVLDEVHAYETYMSTLLDRLLWWAGRLGIPVVLLSATLPSIRREELVRSWCAGRNGRDPYHVPALPKSSEYPRITWSDGTDHRVYGAEVAELNVDRVVRLIRLNDDEIVGWLLERIEQGGCAAVIHNIVHRAEGTFDQLKNAVARLSDQQQPELIFLTGRVAPKTRHEVEERLRSAFGPEASQRPERAIVVGTQVLEQSLDLDFDLMVSDLAPVDSLIQRMGRVQRHNRAERSAHLYQPVLAIAGVEDTPQGPNFPRYMTSVYQRMLLLRTWAVLRDKREVRSPEQVPELVDAVYAPSDAMPCPPGWEEQWRKAAGQLERARENDKHDAREIYAPQPWDDQDIGKLTTRPKSPRRTRKERGRR